MDWDFEIAISDLPEGISLLGILPLGYWMGMNHPDTTGRELFVAVGPRDANARVGDMKIEDDKVKFRFVRGKVTGEEFRRQLLAKYQKPDDEPVLWGVFFPFYKGWSYTGKPQFATRDEALKGITSFELNHGARLCSYHRKDWVGNDLTTLTSAMIWDFGTVGRDEGPITITFTCEENFTIPGGCILDAD